MCADCFSNTDLVHPGHAFRLMVAPSDDGADGDDSRAVFGGGGGLADSPFQAIMSEGGSLSSDLERLNLRTGGAAFNSSASVRAQIQRELLSRLFDELQMLRVQLEANAALTLLEGQNSRDAAPDEVIGALKLEKMSPVQLEATPTCAICLEAMTAPPPTASPNVGARRLFEPNANADGPSPGPDAAATCARPSTTETLALAGASAGLPAPLSATQLPCGHYFHRVCVAAWLGRKDACPTCRQRVGPEREDEDDDLSDRLGSSGLGGSTFLITGSRGVATEVFGPLTPALFGDFDASEYPPAV